MQTDYLKPQNKATEQEHIANKGRRGNSPHLQMHIHCVQVVESYRFTDCGCTQR